MHRAVIIRTGIMGYIIGYNPSETVEGSYSFTSDGGTRTKITLDKVLVIIEGGLSDEY